MLLISIWYRLTRVFCFCLLIPIYIVLPDSMLLCCSQTSLFSSDQQKSSSGNIISHNRSHGTQQKRVIVYTEKHFLRWVTRCLFYWVTLFYSSLQFFFFYTVHQTGAGLQYQSDCDQNKSSTMIISGLVIILKNDLLDQNP